MLNFAKIRKQLRVCSIFMARLWYKFTTTKKLYYVKINFGNARLNRKYYIQFLIMGEVFLY